MSYAYVMSKFFQVVATKALQPNQDALLLTHTVNNLNWLYSPKFWAIERTQMGESYTDYPPVDFVVLLYSPLAPTAPFVVNRFQLTGSDILVGPSFTVWGYKDKMELHAKSPMACSVRALISATIEQAYERDPPLP